MRSLVVVVGDAGRSPRMQYHYQSLLKLGPSTLLGQGGSRADVPVVTLWAFRSWMKGSGYARALIR